MLQSMRSQRVRRGWVNEEQYQCTDVELSVKYICKLKRKVLFSTYTLVPIILKEKNPTYTFLCECFLKTRKMLLMVILRKQGGLW